MIADMRMKYRKTLTMERVCFLLPTVSVLPLISPALVCWISKKWLCQTKCHTLRLTTLIYTHLFNQGWKTGLSKIHVE